MVGIISIIALTVIIALIVSLVFVKIINQGNQALVERLGKYHKTLKPGINFIVPFLDIIVWEETTREQVLDIEPQEAITKDNVSLKVDAIVYWKILDLKKAYYEIENLVTAIDKLVLTTLRSEIGGMELKETFSNRKKINQVMLQDLDEATENWGVKVIRVEIQEIKPAQTVLDSLEKQRAAEIQKKAALEEADGISRYIKCVSEALQSEPNGREVLNFLLAQKYVDANYKLGDSPSSKLIFMDPKALNEAVAELMNYPNEQPKNKDLGNNPDPNK